MNFQNNSCWTILLVCVVATLAGCAAKQPTFADKVSNESGEIGAIGKKWEQGTQLVAKGKKQISKGQEQLEDGRMNIANGESNVERGERLIKEAEAEYNRRKLQLEISD